MEKGLIVGYDLCKDHCRISYYPDGAEEPKDLAFSDEDNPYVVKNSICKKKGEDTWLIGQEGYETALFGAGTIVDKLLRLVSMGGSATFEGVKYSAETLLTHFFEETLKLLYRESGISTIDEIVISLQSLDSTVLDTVIRCVRSLGVDRRKIHIISHTESYLYYVLSRPRELWTNLSVLFDLSGDGLNYYEMEVLRGLQPNVASARRTFLEEGFSLDILETAAGRRMADSIMSSSASRMMNKKLVSAVFLSGRGMDGCQSWGDHFLKVVCERRRVFLVENLFAKGAVYAALDRIAGGTIYPFRLMCEGRINVDITMEVYQGVTLKLMKLSEAGSNWYETKGSFDIIPDQEKTIRLKVKKLGERNPAVIEIPLTDFEDRGNKLTRLGVSLRFISENAFSIIIRDKGFGEFFPAKDTVVRKEYTVG